METLQFCLSLKLKQEGEKRQDNKPVKQVMRVFYYCRIMDVLFSTFSMQSKIPSTIFYFLDSTLCKWSLHTVAEIDAHIKHPIPSHLMRLAGVSLYDLTESEYP